MPSDQHIVRRVEHDSPLEPPTPITPHADADRCEPGLEVQVQHYQNKDIPIVIPDTRHAYVHHGTWPEPIQVDGSEGQLEHISSDDPRALQIEESSTTGVISTHTEKEPRASSTICGVRKRWFILALVIGLLILGAIIGGVLGVPRRSNNSSQSLPQSNTTATTGIIPSSTTTRSTSPTTADAPITTPLQMMNFKLQTWESRNFTGRSQFFYTPGGYRSPFPILAYTWSPGAPGEILDNKLRCSMVLCFDNQFISWRGRSPNQQPDFRAAFTNKSTPLPNVVSIVCDRDFFEPACPELTYLSTFVTVPVMETGVRVFGSDVLLAATGGSRVRESVVTATATRDVVARRAGFDPC